MKRSELSAKERKAAPIARGVLDYFPDALLEVARLSLAANEQHNPGEPMHWAKGKSTDEADALLRHLIDRGTIDVDGQRHSAKVAWRALALLQRELEAEAALDAAGVSKASGGYIHIEQDVPEEPSGDEDWRKLYPHQDEPKWGGVFVPMDSEDRAGEAPEVQIEIRRTSEDKPEYVKGHWEGTTWVKTTKRKPAKPRVL